MNIKHSTSCAIVLSMSTNQDALDVDPFPQPATADLQLSTVLKALADPVRLGIVQKLSDDEYHSCGVEEYGLALHKSTLSHHFKTLREAGVTATVVLGREHEVKLRRADLDARFPGLIAAIAGGSTPTPRASAMASDERAD
jgi:DNA-binding transcriptional ArsR family regulator